MENPIKIDDLGVPLFSETFICDRSLEDITEVYFFKVWTIRRIYLSYPDYYKHRPRQG